MSRRRRLSANPRHVTAAIMIGSGFHWKAVCSCGWSSQRRLRWQISAWDSAAGHLLDVERAEVTA